MTGHGCQDVFVAAVAMGAPLGWMNSFPVACAGLRPVLCMFGGFFLREMSIFFTTSIEEGVPASRGFL
jgi:hypothetical protein